MRPDIAVDEEFTRRILLMKDLKERGVKIVTDATIREMKESGVVVSRNGNDEMIDGESIVLALEVRPERALFESLKENDNVVIVGGDKAPVNALTATRQGVEAGINV